MPWNRKQDERRAHERSGPSYRLDVVIPGSDCLAYLADISTGGLQVHYAEADAMDGVESIEVLFPRWLALGPGIELAGRVAWLGQIHASKFSCGFSFDSRSTEHRNLIEQLLLKLQDALGEDDLHVREDDRPELDDEIPLGVFC